MNHRYTAILVHIPTELLPRIEVAVKELYVTRANFIRESVRRNLRHFDDCERVVAERLKQQALATS